MTSTEHETWPAVVDPVEQGEPAQTGEPQEEAADLELVEDCERVAGPLLVLAIGGMGLVVAVLAPVAGVKIGGLLITAVTVLIVFRLLARRGGGAR